MSNIYHVVLNSEHENFLTDLLPLFDYVFFVAIFGLYRPIKSAIGVRSGRNFVYSPQIYLFDDPENVS